MHERGGRVANARVLQRHAVAHVEHHGDRDGLRRVVEDGDGLRPSVVENFEIVTGEVGDEPPVIAWTVA